MDLNKQVELAKAGDKKSLENIISAIQDNVYGLSLRMLYSPANADDATQEILIKVITNLNSFKGESQFTTWVYKIASNYLIRYKQVEKKYSSTFLQYEESLELDSASKWQEPEEEYADELFISEVRISCLQGLLLCLSRELRITYLLVDIFEVNSNEGAEILEITPALFRKRLSRAREKLKIFLFKNCSLIDKNNGCKCGYHTCMQLNGERFKKENLLFASLPAKKTQVPDKEALTGDMDELNQIGFLFRTNPDAKAPNKYLEGIREIINSKKFAFFNN